MGAREFKTGCSRIIGQYWCLRMHVKGVTCACVRVFLPVCMCLVCAHACVRVQVL
jgi:hypothetical protein